MNLLTGAPALRSILRSATVERLGRNAIWAVLGSTSTRVSSLVAMIVVARLLSTARFGAFGIVQSTVITFQLFAGLGLGLTATKYIASLRVTDRARAGRVAALSLLFSAANGLLFGLVMFVSAEWIADHAFHVTELAEPLRLGSVLMLLSAISAAQAGCFSGLQAFKLSAYANVATAALSLVTTILGTIHFGVSGALSGMAVGVLAGCSLNSILLHSAARDAGITIDFKHCLQEARILWSFSLPAGLSGIMVAPAMWLCTSLLVRSAGLKEMGLFSAANQWFAALLFLPTVLEQVTLPMLASSEGGSAKRILALSVALNGIIILPAAAVLAVASPLIMRLYGPGFVQAWPTLVVVCLTTVVMAMQMPVGQLIISSDRMWWGCALNLAWALALTGFTLLFGQHSALGLASARLLAYILHSLWTVWFVHWILKKEAVFDSTPPSLEVSI
jgi:O-antigen/teichoic acid export membrane protein